MQKKCPSDKTLAAAPHQVLAALFECDSVLFIFYCSVNNFYREEYIIYACNLTAFVNVIKLAKGSVIKGDTLANKTVVWTSFGMWNTTNATVLQVAQMKPIKSKACTKVYKNGPNFIAVPKSSMCMTISAQSGICPVNKSFLF